MEQAQGPLGGGQHVLPFVSETGVVSEIDLLEFDVPVAELFPKELIELVGGVVIAVLLDVFVDCGGDDVVFPALAPSITWERTMTLGRGDDCCNFRWCRGAVEGQGRED